MKIDQNVLCLTSGIKFDSKMATFWFLLVEDDVHILCAIFEAMVVIILYQLASYHEISTSLQ
jgi:hypothetical protein